VGTAGPELATAAIADRGSQLLESGGLAGGAVIGKKAAFNAAHNIPFNYDTLLLGFPFKASLVAAPREASSRIFFPDKVPLERCRDRAQLFPLTDMRHGTILKNAS
jgi:hypothetical protein